MNENKSILKKKKLEDSYYLISRLTIKLYQSRLYSIGRGINIQTSGPCPADFDEVQKQINGGRIAFQTNYAGTIIHPWGKKKNLDLNISPL